MMLACRSTAERHRSLSQGYNREHRLDNWFRGWPSRSALLESQESVGQKKYWLRRLDYRVHAMSPSVGSRQEEDGGRKLLQRAVQAANQLTRSALPKVGAPKSGAWCEGDP